MAHDPHYAAGSGSTVAIKRHPLHPMLVSLPIGFLVGAVISDITYVVLGNSFWAEASFWLLIAGLASGILAAITGMIELSASPRARSLSTAWAHGLINSLVLAITAYNIVIRLDDYAVIVPLGLTLSLITGGLLAVSGWLGGELVFRHGIGVSTNIGQPPR